MISFRDFQEGKSARSRLLGRLKSKGVDLDKIAKDRKAEYERLKKKYKQKYQLGKKLSITNKIMIFFNRNFQMSQWLCFT